MCRENVCDAREATSWARVTAGLGSRGWSSVSAAPPVTRVVEDPSGGGCCCEGCRQEGIRNEIKQARPSVLDGGFVDAVTHRHSWGRRRGRTGP